VLINSEVWDLRTRRLARSAPALDGATPVFARAASDVIYAAQRRLFDDLGAVPPAFWLSRISMGHVNEPQLWLGSALHEQPWTAMTTGLQYGAIPYGRQAAALL